MSKDHTEIPKASLSRLALGSFSFATRIAAKADAFAAFFPTMRGILSSHDQTMTAHNAEKAYNGFSCGMVRKFNALRSLQRVIP
jgi:hypothetical protein